MVNGLKIMNDFNNIIKRDGMQISVTQIYTVHDNDDYDDAITSSGTAVTTWTSGLVQPVTFRGGGNVSQENTLLQQGLIKLSDKTIYLQSGTSLNELTDTKIEIGIGSPNRDKFSLLPQGVNIPVEKDGYFIYQKAFVRRLTTGSYLDG